MLKKSASAVFDIREAYLVKRRSFPDSFGRFTFYVSPFTNDKNGNLVYVEGCVRLCDHSWPQATSHRA